MRSIRFIALVGMAFVFAACGENSSSPTAPAVPTVRMDGGLGVGGSATGDGTGGTTTTTTSTPPTTNQTAQSDTTSRGGLGVGGS